MIEAPERRVPTEHPESHGEQRAKRLLFFGDLAHTGFGTVTSDLGRAMIEMGVDVRFVSQNEFMDLPEPFASRTLDLTTYQFGPGGIEAVHDFIRPLVEGSGTHTIANGQPWGEWKPDAVLLLGDYYGMREMVSSAGIEAFAGVPTFHYCPVEGDDLPPNWMAYWRHIKPIAMSEFGQDEIEKIAGYRPPMVYHGVDSEAFHPVSATEPVVLNPEDNGGQRMVLNSKAACKFALFGNAEVTIAFRADRFMPRKGYDSLIRAMAPVMRERPNLVLVLHCRERDQGGYLPDTVSKYPDIAHRIIRPQWGPLPRPVLIAAYNAADVYVSTSAEGFGLTIAEAIACGVPAVGLDYSAVPEVIGPAGKTVPVGRLLDNEYGHHWALPDEQAFGKAVAYMVDHPHQRLEMGRRGPGHVARMFRWDVAAERFASIMFGESAVGVPADRELVAA